MLITAEASFLLIVDMQERLAPAIKGFERIMTNAARLMSGARRLGVPILVTEHYAKGLGRTVPELRALTPAGSVVEKVQFAALAEPGCREHFAALGRGRSSSPAPRLTSVFCRRS